MDNEIIEFSLLGRPFNATALIVIPDWYVFIYFPCVLAVTVMAWQGYGSGQPSRGAQSPPEP